MSVFTNDRNGFGKLERKYQSKTLKQRLEKFHGKDIEVILKEADESNERPVIIDWGKPVGEEIW